MKLTREGSPEAREPIANKTRSTSEITEDDAIKNNRERINEYWRIHYAKMGAFGAWDQESEKLKTSLVPHTSWNTEGQDLRS